jgi:uncharacterized protein YecT (DUF1311 family)
MIVLKIKKTIIQVCFAMIGLMFNQIAFTQSDPVFTSEATNQCLVEAYQSSPSLSSHRVLDCVGLSSQTCISSAGGDTTIGMMTCLEGELKFWDQRLNQAYAKRMQNANKEDKEMTSIRANTVSVSDSLRRMQRAWVSFRDAACLYEQAQWLGGTGGGPATMACQMHENARQALKLEGWWSQ